MDDELERMKQINIAEIAADYGYELDKRGSGIASLLMRNDAQASKIVVATDARDGHSIFFEVNGEASGSGLDFLQWKEPGLNLGHVRKILRAKLNAPASIARFRKPVPTTTNQAHLCAAWHSMQLYMPGYLESRGLATETIVLFANQIRTDRRGNTIFQHRDSTGQLSGWETKNVGFTGFCAGGQKALFYKLIGEPGTPPAAIVVVESAIDAMSYCQISGQEGLYISFAGGLSPAQLEQLTGTCNRYPAARVMVATDNDAQGETYFAMMQAIRSDALRSSSPVGKDWNDVLR